MYEVILDPSAEQDIDEIFKWYEKQRKNLGFEFLISFDNSLQVLTQNPYACFNITKNVRRIVVKKFPYNIYYTISEITVYVHVIMHQHKDPGDWQVRMENLK